MTNDISHTFREIHNPPVTNALTKTSHENNVTTIFNSYSNMHVRFNSKYIVHSISQLRMYDEKTTLNRHLYNINVEANWRRYSDSLVYIMAHSKLSPVPHPHPKSILLFDDLTRLENYIDKIATGNRISEITVVQYGDHKIYSCQTKPI